MDDLLFDPDRTTFKAFVDYVEEFRHRPCPGAMAWLRAHDWYDVDDAPPEYAYHLLLEFSDVLGPVLRGGTVECLGKDPFWAALAWVSIGGLNSDEYNYLFSRWFWRYRNSYGKRVEEGSIGPGSRAMVR
jgi:hypothetical protein